MSQPLITQQGVYTEIPLTGSIPGAGELVSVPGLQGAAFVALAGLSYLIDPSLNTVVTLLDGTDDGQLVAFQSQAQLAVGGTLIIAGSMQSGPSVGIGLGTPNQTVTALRFRWNEPEGFWEPFGQDVILSLLAIPTVEPRLVWGAGLQVEQTSVLEGETVWRAPGSFALTSTPVRPQSETGIEALSFAAVVNRAYAFDASATLTATLEPVPADGDIIYLVPDPASGRGGVLTLDAFPNTILGLSPAYAIPYSLGYSGSELVAIVLRWNADLGYWQILGNALALAIMASNHQNSIAVQVQPNEFELLELTAETQLAKPFEPAEPLQLLPYGLPWHANAIEVANFAAQKWKSSLYDAASVGQIVMPSNLGPAQSARVCLVNATNSVLPVTLNAGAGDLVQADDGSIGATATLDTAFGRRTWQYLQSTATWYRVG